MAPHSILLFGRKWALSHALMYAELSAHAACLPKVFCVQRMVDMKIQAIKSWVLHVNYALALKRSKASAQLPGKERSPMEWGYTTALYNPCAEALVSPLWHKHMLLGQAHICICLFFLLWENLSAESMPTLNGNLLQVRWLERLLSPAEYN